MIEKFVYLDNAATTKVYPRTAKVLADTIAESWGNPSSLYSAGRNAKTVINAAREKIASILNCKTNEIYFTGCGSESDNFAIKGAVYAKQSKGRHIITTKFEHHAVVNIMKSLERDGFEVTYLDVYENGVVRPEDVRAAIRDDTILICVIFVNNEIGTIQPVTEIAKIAKERKITFFTDAVQAVGHLPIDLAELGVDMLAFSGHKFGAPKGVGGLYIKNGTQTRPLIDGGGQERGKRGGTEAVAQIAAMADALEISVSQLAEIEAVRIKRDRLLEFILTNIPHTRLNGDRVQRIYSNLNVSFEGIEGESLILLLDLAGICASTGSACSSNSLDPSHVLLSIGLPHEIAHGSLRLTLSHETTDEEIAYVEEKLPAIVTRLRDMSPLWKRIVSNT